MKLRIKVCNTIVSLTKKIFFSTLIFKNLIGVWETTWQRWNHCECFLVKVKVIQRYCLFNHCLYTCQKKTLKRQNALTGFFFLCIKNKVETMTTYVCLDQQLEYELILTWIHQNFITFQNLQVQIFILDGSAL